MDEMKSLKKMQQFYAKNNCIPQELVIKDVRLAAAYVPYETLCLLFTPMEALMRGTAFPEIYSPYEGEDKKAKPMEMSKRSDIYE